MHVGVSYQATIDSKGSTRLDSRFVVLKKKNICGIAPHVVQEGDFVHIFHSVVLPFITKRSEGIDGAYKLVGQCYIWGMMQGEGLEHNELD